MSEAIQVSDDALKLMVAEHGVRGTARLLGMDDTMTETFRKRVTRAGWMQDPAIAQRRALASPTSIAAPIVSKVSPIQAQAMELQRLSMESRMSAARGMARAMAHVETLDGQEIIADAGNIKAAVQTVATIHNWADQQAPSRMRIDVLLQKPEQVAAIEVDATVVEGEWMADDVPSA